MKFHQAVASLRCRLEWASDAFEAIADLTKGDEV